MENQYKKSIPDNVPSGFSSGPSLLGEGRGGVIHYCWFGGNPLPKSAKKCIESWKKYFLGWEIKEWNESNFDVNIIPYTRQAYERKKYAFVSDYARFWILYHYGGVYFDTDVKVIKSFDDVLKRGTFIGIEKSGSSMGVNPGLGMGTDPMPQIYKEILDYYSTLSFIDEDGNQIPGTVVKYTTDVLKRHGFKQEDEIQEVAGITIYPNDWFNPLDDVTGRLTITPNTHSIHLYSKTWVDNYGPFRIRATRLLHRVCEKLGIRYWR